MSSRRSMVEEFRSAVRARDPFVLAAVLKLPPVAGTKTAKAPAKKGSEQLKENGTDWSGVLSAWLDAWQAAESVRFCHAKTKACCDWIPYLEQCCRL